MNIFKLELKTNLKSFIFWTLGLFMLVFAGMVKYTAINEAGVTNINAMLDQFPRIVLAVLGIVGLDIGTLGGYYAIITYYTVICAAIYAISLGVNAVSREAIDKTYDFLFTKPRKRNFILTIKLAAGFLYLTLFNLLNYLFSIAAMGTLKVTDSIHYPIVLFCITVYLISLVYYAIAVFISALTKEAEKGSMYSNLLFLITFVIGIISDMFGNLKVLKLLSPLKYFSPVDLLDSKLSVSYVILSIFIVVLCIAGAFKLFVKKDLSAR